MQTISFLNRKGGTGKTTCAVNVAIQLVSLGKSVMFVDTGRNRTTDSLKNVMLDSKTYTGQRKLSVTHIMEGHHSEIAALKKGSFDYIIIDGEPNLPSSVYLAIAKQCDLVLIPVNINIIELDPTKLTLQDIAEAAAFQPDMKCAILPTRINPLTSLDTVMNSLDSLQTEITPFYIPNYKVLTAVPCNTLQVFADATAQILDILSSDHYLFNTDCYGSSTDTRNTILNINYCHYRHCGKQFSSTRKDAKFCPNPRGTHLPSVCKALEARERALEHRKTSGNLVQVI